MRLSQYEKPPLGDLWALDREHPLGGLSVALLLNEGAGTFCNNRAEPVRIGVASSGMAWTTGVRGQPCVSHPTTADVVNMTGAALAHPAITVAMRIYPTSLPAQARLLTRNSAYHFRTKTTQLETFVYTASTLHTTTSATGQIALNQWWDVAFTYDSRWTSRVCRIWVNGNEATSYTAQPTIAAGDIDATVAALTIGSSATGCVGLTDYVYVYQQALPSSMISWLAADPYCMFQAGRRRRRR